MQSDVRIGAGKENETRILVFYLSAAVLPCFLLLLSCLGQESMKGAGLNLSDTSYSKGNPSKVIFRSMPIANPVIRFRSRGQPTPLHTDFHRPRKPPRNARDNVVRGRTGCHLTWEWFAVAIRTVFLFIFPCLGRKIQWLGGRKCGRDKSRIGLKDVTHGRNEENTTAHLISRFRLSYLSRGFDFTIWIPRKYINKAFTSITFSEILDHQCTVFKVLQTWILDRKGSNKISCSLLVDPAPQNDFPREDSVVSPLARAETPAFCRSMVISVLMQLLNFINLRVCIIDSRCFFR